MTDLPIWAQHRARKWLAWTDTDSGIRDIRDAASLAALLAEVATASTLVAIDVERARVLAEVRGVVEGARNPEYTPSWDQCCREILARIEKL